MNRSRLRGCVVPVARRTAAALALGACTLGGGAEALEVQPPPAAEALGELSIEELSAIKVTSVSRRPEPVSQAASSIYVIPNEAILRSGAMSLPAARRKAASAKAPASHSGQASVLVVDDTRRCAG